MHESYLFDALKILAQLGDVVTLDHLGGECRKLRFEAELELMAEKCQQCEVCPYRQRTFEVVQVKDQPRIIE